MDDKILTMRLATPKRAQHRVRKRNHDVGSSNPKSERDSHIVQQHLVSNGGVLGREGEGGVLWLVTSTVTYCGVESW